MTNRKVIRFTRQHSGSSSPEVATWEHPAFTSKQPDNKPTETAGSVIDIRPWLLKKYGDAVIRRVLADDTDTPSDELIYGDRHDRD